MPTDAMYEKVRDGGLYTKPNFMEPVDCQKCGAKKSRKFRSMFFGKLEYDSCSNCGHNQTETPQGERGDEK